MYIQERYILYNLLIYAEMANEKNEYEEGYKNGCELSWLDILLMFTVVVISVHKLSN